MEELNEKKTKYFVIAIIILIILGVLLIVHFNNKQMVKGEEDSKSDTVTTTEKVTTTKKRVYVEEEKEEVIYKSVIDEDNKFVYNYKLTEEITETDVIISKKLELTKEFIEKDFIGLFDISLYDSNLVKKNVSNSLITIKVPLTETLKGYDEYKVVYINDKNEITSELFEVKVDSDYIEFNTTHLSVFGIIGTKKVVEEVVDLSKVTIDVKVNEEVVDKVTNILLEKEDKVELVVNNINENCDIYYGLKAIGTDEVVYELYDNELKLEETINYRLYVKVTYLDNYEVFEIGNIGLYDKVYEYNKNTKLDKDLVIGEIKSETEEEYEYDNKETNLDIVIDNITEPDVENTDSNAVINVNGNIYLVEETDISELKMKGYLYIDTDQNIHFNKNDDESIILDGLYTLTIRSKEFTLNGVKYSYEYTDNGLVIYVLEEKNDTEVNVDNSETVVTEQDIVAEEPIVDVTEETDKKTEISLEDFNNLFAGDYEVIINDDNKNDLVIGIKDVVQDSGDTPSDGVENNSEPQKN